MSGIHRSKGYRRQKNITFCGIDEHARKRRKKHQSRPLRIEFLQERQVLAGDLDIIPGFPGPASCDGQPALCNSDYPTGMRDAFLDLPAMTAEGEGESSEIRLAQRNPIEPTVPWQNPTLRMDVNGDGAVVPGDALIQINWINANGAKMFRINDTEPRPEIPFLDTNGDDWITPLDVLVIVNWLNNDVPQAANDSFLIIKHASEMTLRVLDNDVLPFDIGTSLSISSVSESNAGGTVTIVDGTDLLYTPPVDFVGDDTFTYSLGASGLATDIGTVTVRITSVNAPPTIVNGLPEITVDEDGSPQALDVSGVFSDSDVASLGDRLSFSLLNANPGLLEASLAGFQLLLTLHSNQSGSAEISLTATDLAGATATNTLTVTVMPVNDAPVGLDSAVTMTVDTTYSFGVVDFGFSDPNDSPANALLGIKITALPEVGSLKLDGTAVIEDQIVTAADLVAGKLTFEPVTGAVGRPYASFQFQIQDDGGIQAGGSDSDPTPKTLTINVVPLNHAPTEVQLGPDTVAENVEAGTTVGELTVGDTDAGDIHTLILVAGEGDSDNAAFVINGQELKTAAAFDFETQNTFHIRVRATDSGGLSVEQMLTIQVTNENETPTQITLLGTGISEEAPVGSVVGLLSTVDPDAADTATFSLVSGAGDVDNASFVIVGNELKSAVTFDFETQGTYHIRVQATDAGGLSVERELVVNVTNENEAPTDITLSGTSISEHTAIGSVVGQLAAVDSDAGDSATFSLVSGVGGDDNASFTIDGNELKTAVPLDFETQNTYHIRVQATDAGGLTVEQTFVVEVLDEVNEAPTAIELTANVVAENSATGTVVGTLSATDPNAGDTLTFSLVSGVGSDDNAAFTIVGDELQSAANFDFETQSTYHIRVRATDSGGLTFEQTFVVQVTNENEAPTEITLLGDSVSEQAAIDTVVGQLSAADPDAVDTASFTLVSGVGDEDNASFTIVGNELKSAVTFDFETQSSYHIRVQATDAGGLSIERELVVHVTNENEAPTDITLSGTSISEHAAVGSVVGQLAAIDVDAGDTATFSFTSGVGDEDNANFTINGDQLTTAVPLDFETQSTYYIRLQATDAGGLSVEQTLVIEVLDEVNEAPTAISLTANAVQENSAIGTVVGVLSATDPNAGDTLTFSLVSGAGSDDNAAFTIVDNELQSAANVDFETQDTYHIRVRTTDSGGLTFEQTFVVQVTNENEAPTEITLLGDSVSEQAAIDTIVGQLSAADPDAVDTASFTLVSGVGDEDNASFTIVGNELKSAVTFDFETQRSYHIRVQATDAGGLSVERELVVNVTNENEAPTDITLSGTSISEHAAVGSVIGQLSSVDVDAGDTATFSLVAGAGGDDNAAFAIDSNQLKTAVPLDFETQSTYHIRIQAIDAGGLSVEQTFVIEILDEVNEAPTTISLTANSLLENSATGTLIGVLSATDPNASDTHTFSLVSGTGSDDNAAFTIVGDELQSAANFDFETQSTYHIRVRATDDGGLSVEQTFDIQITNENESPTDITLIGADISEQAAIDTVVGQLSAVDPDTGDTATFSLISGTGDEDNASFTIAGNGLKTAVTFDFETRSTYHIRVQATDAGGLSVERELVVNVTNENEAPTDITLSGTSISEHAAVGSVVGQLSSIDVDAGDTATFTFVAGLGDEDNVAFTIDGNQLKMAVPLDFETQNTYHIRLQATDAGGLSVEQTFVIEVLDEVNEAPTAISLTANALLENSATGTVIGVISATDPNAGDTHTFSLVSGAGSDDNAAFTIVDNELQSAAILDFETQDTYHIRVRATDEGGLTFEQTFVVQVTNENETPTDITLVGDSVSEQAAIDTVVGQLSAADPDTGDTATFSLISGAGDEDNASFTIVGNELKSAITFDFEAQSTYHIRVQATDAGGLSLERELVVHVTNENEAPTDITLSGTSISEHTAIGSVVGQLAAVDSDAGDSATFSLVSGVGGDDNASFTIDGNELKTAVPLDFETQNTYHIRVQATDAGGLTVEQTFVVEVLDEVNEAPTAIELTANVVAENSATGTVVGTLSATDPNAGDTLTFSLVFGVGSDDNAAFTIVGNALQSAANFDFEAQDTFQIRVRATDSGGLTFEQAFIVQVTNENEAPTEITLLSDSVSEQAAIDTVVGQLSAADPDTGDTATFSLISGAGDDDNASFTIAGNELKTAVTFDFETQSTYHIRVRATDAGGLSVERELVVNVTNENEAPTDITLSGTSISEHAAVGSVVGQLSSIDVDAGDTATFSFIAGSGDEDNVAFTIDGNQLKTAVPLDFETHNTYHIRVQATDAGGLTVEQTFVIEVLDEVNEAPTAISLTANAVLENSATGTVVGVLSATDPNASDTHTFSLVSGAGSEDNAAFTIVGNELQSAVNFDFEAQDTFHIRVRATDSGGLTFEQTFVVQVTNENETPTEITLLGDSVSEQAAIDTVVGQLSAADPDAVDTASFTLVSGVGDEDNASFTIVGNELKSAITFDFETQSTYHIRVQATDAGGLSVERELVVNVTNENEAPTDITLSGTSISEHTAVGSVVGQLSSVDVDAGDTATFSLVAGAGGDDNAAFTIDGNQLKTAVPLDFETQSTYHIRVRATDVGGLSVEQTFDIQITNENESPTDITLIGADVSEQAAIDTVVGQFSVVDPDAGDTATFSLISGAGDDDNASFTIKGNELKSAVTFDFEMQETYHIRVRATDDGGLSAEQTFVIQITNKNEAPTDITLLGADISELAAVDTAVGLLSAVDPDAGDTATFSLVSGAGDDDNVAFTIVGNELKSAITFDFEAQSTYHIRVQATDAGGLSLERELVVHVTNENETPSDITLSETNISEHAAVGSVIGQLASVDPDAGDTATFSLISGVGDDDNAAFTIDGNELKTAILFDFETQSTYHIRVQVTDAGGLSVERALVVHVTDENDAPTGIKLSGTTISEHAPVGSIIGQLTSVDPDAGDTATFSLISGVGDDDNASFTIDGNELKTAGVLDFETQSTYHIRVRATDAGGLSAEQTFVIEILDEANEAPTDIALSADTVLENSTLGTLVGMLSALDPNPGDTATFSLVAGTGSEDNSAFNIEGSELKTAATIDFETHSTYHIRVRATDTGGLSVERAIVVHVTDANEAPTDIALPNTGVPEDAPVGTVTGQFSATDPDASDSATFSLVSGTGDDDNAAFTIDGNELKTAVGFDFETQNIYQIRVRATDAGGLSVERTFAIAITNVNEAPVNHVPGAQATNMNQALTLSTAGNNAISVSDVDAGTDSIRVRLVAHNGTISVDDFFGSIDEINALLDGIVFTPDQDFQGEASLEVITDDLGHNGSGSALSDVDEITINVN